MKLWLTIIGICLALVARPQAEAVRALRRYRYGLFNDAAVYFQQALQKDPNQPVLYYNAGNALYKAGDAEAALRMYAVAAGKANTVALKANSYYNTGVLHHKAGRLPQAIAAYKQALLVEPNHAEARHNLQLALADMQKNEKRASTLPTQPQPPQRNITQKQAEQLLKALEQREKNLRMQMMRKTPAPAQPEKDW